MSLQTPVKKMASAFRAIISRSQSLLSTPSSSTTNLNAADGLTTAKDARSLFPVVDPAVDGEDCDRDCATCTIRYPSKFSVNEDDELYGHVKGWSVHLLVATGKNDWVRDVADERGSIMEALKKSSVKPKNGRLMVSASNMLPPPEFHHGEDGHQPTTVLVLPSFTIVDLVTPADVPELINRFVDTGPTTTAPLTTSILSMLSATAEQRGDAHGSESPQSNSEAPSSPQTEPEEHYEGPPDPNHLIDAPPAPSLSSGKLSSRPCAHTYLILLCSQKTRDARCGQSAPLLRRELERHLRPLGLYRDLDDERPGGVGIYFISHVGGHKYSANMMIYRRDEGQAIWLARIKPEHIEGIVKHTVLQGKVVHPDRQLRGGFDRQKGLTSW
ncbi:hypothetical protein FGG08_006383 [Glutinoglossum americanum]|uniref:Uncharacterized protein n=1 Tax=Glutinoglossum americanum TaxID=1670608 RepID=A0A9P8HYG4_9PEZI|nr:hypothetical protein FGG08_006383 [Glutinoglossum americanum]